MQPSLSGLKIWLDVLKAGLVLEDIFGKDGLISLLWALQVDKRMMLVKITEVEERFGETFNLKSYASTN
ncbi:hypothetical protein H6P81_000808 [Aristolochia fimbriata]|uniref:Uncharacterized protein n=1 Tax=Aristolochia fimbriata TaxID=158543 RepID=A0AAV7F547_ARIFI|nr:hypothetical protein H6P81_000808 [Aristolochia fimbriata]